MTIKQKNELIAAVTALLERMIPVEQVPPFGPTPLSGGPHEMLTVKECAALVSGLTKHRPNACEAGQGEIHTLR